MTQPNQWTKPPVSASGYTLLTPNPVSVLTHVNDMGAYTFAVIGGLQVTDGYIPPSGTAWTKV